MQYRKPWLTVSEGLRCVKLNRPRLTPWRCQIQSRVTAGDDGNPSEEVHRCHAPVIRSRMAHAAMLATWASMPPFRGGHACPGTLELKIVGNRVRRDVAGRPVNAAAVAGRRSAEIEPLDRRARSR